MVENTNTSVRFDDSTTIRDIRLKYRYSTRPRVEYQATIGLLFDPDYWPIIKYFPNSKAGSSYSPNLVIFGTNVVKYLCYETIVVYSFLKLLAMINLYYLDDQVQCKIWFWCIDYFSNRTRGVEMIKCSEMFFVGARSYRSWYEQVAKWQNYNFCK